MKLYLDDVRPTPAGFDLRAVTAEDAIEHLQTGTITFISLDHDLGINTLKTGYDVAKWIEEQVYTNPDFHMPMWDIHSMNPTGAENIRRALISAERYLIAQRGCHDRD